MVWAAGAAVVWGAWAGVPSAIGQQCQTDWTLHLPQARVDAAMAFDNARGKMVLFGGYSAPNYRADTWESDGQGWRLVSTFGPAARRGHKMVYDPVRGRTLLIAGYASPTLGGVETWAWDGATWRMLDGSGPAYAFTSSAAQECAVAFDPGRSRVVMLLATGQTWEWDGNRWEMMSDTGPSGGTRRGMAMSYHRSPTGGGGGRVVLFGGAIGATVRGDTWSWDGREWTPMVVTGAPPGRSDHRMEYDPVGRRVVMYGGAGAGGGRLRDTWALTGTSWTLLSASSVGPASVAGGAGSCMAYDSARSQAVLVGGSNGIWTDICTFDGTRWTQVNPGPAARTGAAAAYDESRRRLVLFGGLSTARLGDTWEFDGSGWAQTASTGPVPRTDAAMAYDPVRGRVVMFGGSGPSGALNDVWECSGKGWERVFPLGGTGPSARERAAMCWDPITQRVMLEGGSVGGSETWLWDGAAWMRVANGPTRAGHAMAYMPSLNMVVLYGGSGGGTNQTAFGWDGSGWMAIGGPGPSTAIEHSLTLDPVTGTLVLLGPSSSDAASWLFDGLNWRRVPTPSPGNLGPRARNNHAAWYDQTLGCIAMFGGTVSGAASRETWEYRGVAGPQLARAPTWVVSCAEGTASFTVEVANLAGAAPVESVMWLRGGQLLSPGATAWGSTLAMTENSAARTYTLTITGVRDADTGEYSCALTTLCGGATVTNPARLMICPADFDCSGTGSGNGVTPQDIYAFFGAYFAGDLRADFTRDGVLSPQDFFDFLARYFGGC